MCGTVSTVYYRTCPDSNLKNTQNLKKEIIVHFPVQKSTLKCNKTGSNIAMSSVQVKRELESNTEHNKHILADISQESKKKQKTSSSSAVSNGVFELGKLELIVAEINHQCKNKYW